MVLVDFIGSELLINFYLVKVVALIYDVSFVLQSQAFRLYVWCEEHPNENDQHAYRHYLGFLWLALLSLKFIDKEDHK